MPLSWISSVCMQTWHINVIIFVPPPRPYIFNIPTIHARHTCCGRNKGCDVWTTYHYQIKIPFCIYWQNTGNVCADVHMCGKSHYHEINQKNNFALSPSFLHSFSSFTTKLKYSCKVLAIVSHWGISIKSTDIFQEIESNATVWNGRKATAKKTQTKIKSILI